jgi:hypothetical protein
MAVFDPGGHLLRHYWFEPKDPVAWRRQHFWAKVGLLLAR